MTRLQILLVDDHVVMREGLKRLIDAEADMIVVGEAADPREAIAVGVRLRPDVAVMKVSITDANVSAGLRELVQACPEIRVLALTGHEDAVFLRELLEAGASGYVLKRAAAEELIHAVRVVAAGGVYVDPRVASTLLARIRKPGTASGLMVDLSERESAVLRLIAQGYTNKEIAARLMLSVKTVETYKARSMEKLGLRSRVDIVRIATQRGWFPGP